MGDLALHVPKPMVLLAGKPILEHQFDSARRYACRPDFVCDDLAEAVTVVLGKQHGPIQASTSAST
jgi:NDP-sugar pyrophosphorylase family protein